MGDKLELKIPDDFKAGTPAVEDDLFLMYWIYNQDGEARTYLEATADETIGWAKESLGKQVGQYKTLFDAISSETLSLAVNRAAFIGAICAILVDSRSNLFGSKDWWDNLPEWRRLKRAEEMDKKRAESGKD